MSDQQFKKHPDVPVEPDVMPSGKLFVWVGAMCAVVIVVTIMVWQEFNHATTREMQKKQLARIEPALAKAAQADKRAADAAKKSGTTAAPRPHEPFILDGLLR